MDGGTEISTAIAQDSLRVELIDTLGGFQALKNRWRALEGRDPEGTVFLSWDWLAQAFERATGRWRVVAVFHGARLVAAMPLKYRVHWSRTREEFQTEIEAGGRLLYSEYTGFLCEPTYEDSALKVMAGQLQAMPWIRLSIRYEVSESRAARFMAAFPEDRFRTRSKTYHINRGETDNLACPQVNLPEDYETYLTQGPSKNTRQKIRRFTRKYLENGDFQITHSSGRRLKEDMSALLRLWMLKWAPVKGNAVARQVAGNYLRVLSAAERLGLLYLPVLRQGDRVIGALGHVLDPRFKRVHFILAGRDETVTGNFVGLLLHSQSIRWAIENGYSVYDFCHGNEPYKYSFGAQDIRANYFSIRPLSLPEGQGALDTLGHKEALARVLGFLEAGKTEQAARGCRQLVRQMHEAEFSR